MAVDLTGKVCLVTGASRGVGRGVALGLLEAGATVHITGRTTSAGHRTHGHRCGRNEGRVYAKHSGLANKIVRTSGSG